MTPSTSPTWVHLTQHACLSLCTSSSTLQIPPGKALAILSWLCPVWNDYWRAQWWFFFPCFHVNVLFGRKLAQYTKYGGSRHRYLFKDQSIGQMKHCDIDLMIENEVKTLISWLSFHLVPPVIRIHPLRTMNVNTVPKLMLLASNWTLLS